MQQLAQPTMEGFVATTVEGTKVYGVVSPVPMWLRHLYSCRPVELVNIQQPNNPKLHWMPVAADGTRRHEAWYVHCTPGGTSNPGQLSSRWPLGGREEWAMLCVPAQHMDFDAPLPRGYQWPPCMTGPGPGGTHGPCARAAQGVIEPILPVHQRMGSLLNTWPACASALRSH